MFEVLRNGVVVGFWGMVLASVGFGQEVPSGSSVPTEKSGEAAAIVLPDPPAVRLAPISGFDDGASYLRSVDERVAGMVTRADQASDVRRQVDLWLAAANLILALRLEPACTTRILRMDNRPGAGDAATIERSLDLADSLIKKSRSAVAGIVEADEELTKWSDQASDRAATLEAFSVALRAFVLPSKGDDGVAAARSAASNLSALLESSNPSVASCAGFWRTVLRDRAGKTRKTISVRSSSLANPDPESLPYAYHSKLQRSRALAARGSNVASVALLMQIEELCHEWFEVEATREGAIRAAQLVRIQVMADWFGKLSPDDQSTKRAWCVKQIRGLLDDQFSKDANTVYRLNPAIPIVAPAPETADSTSDTPSDPVP